MDARQKWQEATRQILLALDLPAEYRLLGLDVCGHKPSGKGWLECRAYGLEDRTPSAGINVQDGPFLGRYKSFRDGQTESLFDFAARTGKCGGDWKECRNFYARQTNVKLPDGAEETVADRFDFYEPTVGQMLTYTAGKPGVSVEALREVGCRAARWPKSLPPEMTNHLFAVPMYGSGLLDSEPCGWHTFTQNPRLKIRKFQGKGKEESLLKTLTAGEYGLMNVDGLHRLEQAQVVWIVEGISDLLAAHSVLREWRLADPEQRQHVVLSAGGCTYHCRAEWVPLFAGKDVRVCFDVGDAKDEGQIGAAQWVASLLPVAKSVRNIRLPLGAEGGKNDLRDWLTSGKRSYADLLEFSETFAPVEPTDTAQAMTGEAALLASLGLEVMGRNHDRSIEVYCRETNQHTNLKQVAKLQPADLVLLIGAETFHKHVHVGKELPPGMHTMEEVRLAIADAASRKLVSAVKQRVGTGLWLDAEHALLVMAGRVAKLKLGEHRLEFTGDPFQGSVFCDIAEASDWIDTEALSRYLLEAKNAVWRQAQFEELQRILRQWYWKSPRAAEVVSGLAVASLVQTFWKWRPQVFLTGSSAAGKSSLMEDVLQPLFGGLAWYMLKPTEASIRQKMRHHFRIPLVDEFEDDHNKQRVLSLFRISGRGGDVFRGTTDQMGRSYHLRHLPWFSAIDTGLSEAADANRFLIFEMGDIPAESRQRFQTPDPRHLRDLGVRLLASVLVVFRAAEQLCEQLRRRSLEGVTGRTVDCLSVPFAIIGAMHALNLDGTLMLMEKFARQEDWLEQRTRDEETLLENILAAELTIGPGNRLSVAQTLHDNSPDAGIALERVGLKRNFEAGTVWLYPKAIERNLLRNQKQIGRTLARVPGAQRVQRKIGGSWFWGYEVSEDVIGKLARSEGFSETGSEQESLA